MEANVDLKERISSFRCIFSIDLPQMKDKIRSIKIKLDKELEADDDSMDEVIEKLNFYTWIEFQLGNSENAKKHNRTVLEMTNGKNVTAVINKAYMLLREGDEGDAGKCIEKAEKLRERCEGDKLMTSVEAELAYSFGRLGGLEYLKRAIEMYTAAVNKYPEMYAWKFGLGLLHRRATHTNVWVNMNSKLSVGEHVALAFELLNNVAEECQESSLKGRAYSQLASIAHYNKNHVNSNQCLETLIDAALKYGQNDARILTDCGKILRFSDLNKATNLLEKSLMIKRNSTTLHHLGLCYQEKAKTEARKMHFMTVRGLSRNDVFVILAIECYQAAIKMSCDFNIPAVFSLGMILRLCNDFDEALKQFNQIISLTSKKSYTGKNREELQELQEYLITVTKAYEQAGYCLFAMAKIRWKTREEVAKLNNSAELKFLQAISLAATMSSLDPEIKRYEVLIWNAFKHLDTNYEEIRDSPRFIKRYIELLNISTKYIRIPLVIEKLRCLSEKKLADSNVIAAGLDSFLVLEQYESAYAFLTCPMVAKLCHGPLRPLASKISLYTAASRLQARESSAKFILKPFFDSCFEKDETNPYEPDLTDVCIAYDVKGQNSSVEVLGTVSKLQEIISGDLGLSVTITDETAVNGLITVAEHVPKIRRAKTVLILLNGDPLSSSLKNILDLITTYKIECNQQGKPGPHILIGLNDRSVDIPDTLVTYPRTELWNLLDKIQVIPQHENHEEVKERPQFSGAVARHVVTNNPQHKRDIDALTPFTSSQCQIKELEEPKISRIKFDDSTLAKMLLYCAMSGQEWPV